MVAQERLTELKLLMDELSNKSVNCPRNSLTWCGHRPGGGR